MFQSLLYSILVVSHLAALAASQSQSDYANSTSVGCQKLASAYPESVFLPSSTEYVRENSVNENWSRTCALNSTCIFEPASAQDLADALIILKKTKTKFAVRSGGHMPVPGAANIVDGVLISMVRLNTLSLSSDQSVAQIGTGLRWEVVYSYLSPLNLTVPGGRYGNVGVGGLLLGGGINYFGSEVGWSMNNVVNYEVVLANGTIVNANSQWHPDLAWALKGGSSNFGIVTRFDMKTLSISAVYGGLSVYPPQALNQYVDAIASYMASGGGLEDPKSAIDPSVGITPATGEISLFNIIFHRGPDPAPQSLANFTALPTAVTDVSLRPDFASFAADGANPIFADKTHRRMFWSIGMKATPESVYLANSTFFAAASTADIADFQCFVTYQPISAAWISIARAAGGDTFDLDPAKGSMLSLELSLVWTSASEDAKVVKFARDLGNKISSKAAAIGQAYPFVYINDGGVTQSVFRYYGNGKSLPKMKAVAKVYDPEEVFQELMPGGFKLDP